MWCSRGPPRVDAQDFLNTVTPGQDGLSAKAHINALITAAKNLSNASKAQPQPGAANLLPALQQKQADVVTAENRVLADILANACKALQAGCFAAGTKLLTRTGWRAVEEIQPGEEVLSRDESDPAGEPSWQPVEAVFRRTGYVLHLHIVGEVIRTTPEHPFWVEGKGWTAAGALRVGDKLATLTGEWVAVEEVYDTGTWEAVYNLRVAEWHTYFVGDEHWGFAPWAHNEYKVLFIKDSDNVGAAPYNVFRPFQVQNGANAGASIPSGTTSSQVSEAKAIVLRIINALRASMKNDFAKKDTTAVAFVLVKGHVELWVSQNGGGSGPITAERRRALYQALTQDSVVKAYLAANNIKVELKPNSQVCAQTAKQVLNPKNTGNLTGQETAAIELEVNALKQQLGYAGVPDADLPPAVKAQVDARRAEGLALLNHAERQIYRQLELEIGETLLAIGSTIKMCESCEAVTVAVGLQYAIAVPTVSGNYVTTPPGWTETF